MMISNPLERSRLAPLCFEAIRSAGHDLDVFAGMLGVDPDPERLARATHTAEQTLMFWQALECFSGDSDIGLTLGQHLRVCEGEVFDYLFLSADHFGLAVEHSLPFMRLLSDDLCWSLRSAPDGVWLEISARDPVINTSRHFFECLFLGLVRFWRTVTADDIGPRVVELAASAPATLAPRQDAFACTVHYGRPVNRLFIHQSTLARPGRHANPGLFGLHEHYARQMLRRIEDHDFLRGARHVIAELLQFGEVTLEMASRRLGMSSAELKARLGALGTHFLREREQCRWSLANQMLRKSNESITQIALRAGFSEPSTFYRAFKRWSKGETPADFRARHRVTG